MGGAFGGLEQLNLIFARKTKGTGNQKRNPRSTKEAPGRHQGGTKEAPGRHQGGTKEAPGRHQGGTREAPGRHASNQTNYENI